MSQSADRREPDLGARDGVDKQEVGLLIGGGQPAVGGAHDVARGEGRIREGDAVEPGAGAVREAAQRVRARGGAAVVAGVEDQARPAEERSSVEPGVGLVGGAPGVAGGGRGKHVGELQGAVD
jgi:hypothetical protein